MKKIILITAFILLAAGANNAQDILNAVRKGNVEEVKQHLASDPNLINTKDEFRNDLLFLAILNKDLKMAELLLKSGIDVTYARKDVGNNALHTAAGTGPIDMIKLLLSYSVDMNKVNSFGTTPLITAITREQKEIAYLLLEKGASFSFDPRQRESLLRSALAGGMEKIVDQLANDTTIDYFKKTSSGNTYLHAVAQGGISSFAERLIQKGLNINEKNIYGWSPIHFAASRGQTGIIETFVRNGGKKNIRTNDGKTPYNIARDFEQQQTAEFLQQRGFDTSAPHFPTIRAKYLDPELPDTTPRLFAPGIVSQTHTFEHCPLTFSSDLQSLCWADWNREGISKIFLMEKEYGVWQAPKTVQEQATNPCISPDGQRIFFTAKRKSRDGQQFPDPDIYYIERKGNGWSEPINVGGNVNTNNEEKTPTVDWDGTLYFTYNADIYRSQYINGKYAPKEKLLPPVNSGRTENQPFISQDGTFIIYQSYGSEGVMAGYVNICFRRTDGTWTDPVKLSEKIKINGLFPAVTPDNKYLFFFQQDYFWVDAKIIEELRSKE
ncbi:MAG: ankyrin repeat domain-containing protein [Bacteroidota bacterium]